MQRCILYWIGCIIRYALFEIASTMLAACIIPERPNLIPEIGEAWGAVPIRRHVGRDPLRPSGLFGADGLPTLRLECLGSTRI